MSDLIYRQAAIDTLNEKCRMPVWCNVLVEKMLKSLPSAQERKRGRWKGEGLGDYRCSLCGEVTRHARTNFCPNCGADMRKDGKQDG